MAASVWQISLHISCFTLNWGWKYLFWLITLLVLCSWIWNFDLRFYYCKGNKKFWYICIFRLTKYHILQIIRHTGPYCAPRSQKVHTGKKYFIGTLRSSWQMCWMKWQSVWWSIRCWRKLSMLPIRPSLKCSFLLTAVMNLWHLKICFVGLLY